MNKDQSSEDDFFLTQLLHGSNQREFDSYSTKDQPTKEHLEFLLKHFGHRNFRPMQWKIISSILNEKRDNLSIMTTGYGKSLCYQYPSAFKNSITLVISPLISLMEDQILSLTVSRIPACLLGSAQSLSKTVIADIFENKYRLIYLTPEYCTGNVGSDLLKRMNKELDITLIAVDEAHCVTSWGHDFRQSYRKLSLLKEIFSNVPILAVTATATPKVKSDIIKVLKLKSPQVLGTGFDRPNLYFSVFPKDETIKDFKSLMVCNKGKWVFSGSTIIYCLTRQQTTDISNILNHYEISNVSYHAGLNLKERKKAHEDFVKDKVSVIVATIAFGMGIDKPDIRLIIHYGTSSSIEGYYQEVGRAGRDGLPAKCVVFWSAKDFVTHSFLRAELSVENQSRKAMMADLMHDYLTTTNCRRHFILSHFEDNENVSVQHPTNCCDNCDNKDKVVDTQQYEGVNKDGMYDFTEDAVTFLSAVAAIAGKFGMERYILFLKGSKNVKVYDHWKKHKLYGSGAHKSDTWWKEISNLMIQEKLLVRKMNRGEGFAFASFSVSASGMKFLNDATNNGFKLSRKPSKPFLELLKKHNLPSTSATGWLAVGSSKVDIGSFRSKSETKIEMNSADKNNLLRIYHMLLAKRTELARDLDIMPYTIASNAALMSLAKNAPKTLDDLRKIHADGFTEAKIETFGPGFIKIIVESGVDLNARSQPDGIQKILEHHPIENTRMPTSAITTYTLYKTGKTVEEIMEIRKLAKSTVTGHLIDAMKCGFPVTLSSMGVTRDDLNTIVGVINDQDLGYKSLSQIKFSCPEHITFDQIRAVCAYLQVRDHLKTLGIPYKDFEPEYSYDQCELTQLTQCGDPASNNNEDVDQNSSGNKAEKESASNESTDCVRNKIKDTDRDDVLPAACTEKLSTHQETKAQTNSENGFEFDDNEDDFLLAACGEMERSYEGTNENMPEPPSKKTKNELDRFLELTKTDVPNTSSDYKQKESLSKNTGIGKNQKLPPWLKKKRPA